MFGFTNNLGSTISGLSFSFDYERYRINTAAASVTFSSSTDGINWTVQSAGNSGAFTTGASAYNFASGTVVSKAPSLTGLTIAAGSSYYVKWVFDTTGANSQGIGLDNFSMSATLLNTSLYWAGNGSALGGSGTWDAATTSSWSQTNSGSITGTTWDSSKTANFASTSGTVTVAVAGVTAGNGIVFDSAGYTVTGSGAVTLSSSPSISVTNAPDTATVNAQISGTVGLNKAGAGTLILGGANNYTGDTTISSGVLQVGAGGNSGTISGNVANSGALVFNRLDAISYSGLISGTGSLTQNGPGVLALTGNNSYAGATTISAGAINIQHANALGGTGAGTTVQTGAALQIQGGITTAVETLTLSGNGVSNDGALRNMSGNNTYSGAVNLAGSSRINSDSGSLTLTGGVNAAGQNVIFGGEGTMAVASSIATGNGSVTKDGTGTLALNGNNTFTGGVIINGGALQVGHPGALNNSSQNSVTFGDAVPAGTKLQLFGNSVTVSGLNTGATPGGAVVENGHGSTNSVLTVNNAADNTFAGVIQNGGAGTLGLVKTGSAVLNLSGNNSYGGGTTIDAGTVKAATNTALGTGAVVNKGNLYAANGVTLGNGIVINSNSSSGTGTVSWNMGTASPSSIDGAKLSGGTITQVSNNGTTTLLSSSAASSGYTGASGTNNAETAVFTGSFNIASSTGLEFTLTPQAGQSITFTNFQAGMRSTATGPLNWGLYSNSDAYSTALQSGGITNTSTWTLVGGSPAFSQAASTGSLSFRLYAYGSSATNATAGTANWRVDDMTLTYSYVLGAGALASLGTADSAATVTLTGPITLNGGVNLQSATGSKVIISGNISDGVGSNPVVINSPGTVQLSGNNSYGGGTTLSSGQLNINSSTALGTGLFVINGGAINNTSGGLVTLTAANPLQWNGDFTFLGSSSLNLGNGPLTLGNDITVTISQNVLTAGGGISGSHSITKQGAGTLLLTGTNSYTGNTNIGSGGGLEFDNAAALGSSSTSNVYLGAHSFLRYTGSLSSTVQQNVDVANETGTLINTGGGTLILSGTLTKTGTILQFGGGNFNVTGHIVGNTGSFNSDLVVNTGSNVILSSTNNYSGPTYVNSSSTLSNGITDALPVDTTIILGDTASYSGPGTYNLGGYNQSVSSIQATAGSSNVITNNGAGTSILTLTGVTTTYSNSNYAGIIKDGSGAVALEVTGGTHMLSGNNTYTGGTTISGSSSLSTGTLVVQNISGSGTGTGPMTVNQYGILTSGNTGVINSYVRVNSNGVLSGIGTVSPGAGNSLTVSNSATVDPSTLNDPDGIVGTLNVDLSSAATATFAPGSIIQLTLNGGGLEGLHPSDMLNFTGMSSITQANFNGAHLYFDFLTGTTPGDLVLGDTYNLFQFNLLPSSTYLSGLIVDGSSFSGSLGSGLHAALALGTGANDHYIQLQIIPEPSTCALLCFGLIGLVTLRRLTAKDKQKLTQRV